MKENIIKGVMMDMLQVFRTTKLTRILSSIFVVLFGLFLILFFAIFGYKFLILMGGIFLFILAICYCYNQHQKKKIMKKNYKSYSKKDGANAINGFDDWLEPFGQSFYSSSLDKCINDPLDEYIHDPMYSHVPGNAYNND